MYIFYDLQGCQWDAHLQIYITYKIDVTNLSHYKGQSFRDFRLEISRMNMKCRA